MKNLPDKPDDLNIRGFGQLLVPTDSIPILS